MKKAQLLEQTFGFLKVIGYEGTYKGHTMWRCRCKCGNEVILPQGNLKSGNTTSCGCRRASSNGSKDENILKDFVKSLGYNVSHERKILDGKEIDIFVSEKNIGIEYNGSVVHASLGNPFRNKSKMYHRDKFLLAKEKGIHLVSVFDVDWYNNQERLKSYVASLVLPSVKISVADCEVRKVDYSVAYNFVDMFCLQKPNKAVMKINYGLYYNDELYMLMSFGYIRLQFKKEGYYELHRYCFRYGYEIKGGEQLLLSAFERDYKPKYLLAYSNNDYFNGLVYPNLGFTEILQSIPRYYWYKNKKEMTREKCQLKRLKELYPNLLQEAYDVGASNKEDYVMLKLKAVKVYRSGNTKWEKQY